MEETKKPDVEKAIEKKQKETKGSSHGDDKNKKRLKFSDFKGEFKKLIWPTRPVLIKQTITVISTSIFVGIIIFVIDSVFNYGYSLLAGLFM